MDIVSGWFQDNPNLLEDIVMLFIFAIAAGLTLWRVARDFGLFGLKPPSCSCGSGSAGDEGGCATSKIGCPSSLTNASPPSQPQPLVFHPQKKK
ncbi:MAG: hypothetical protein HQL50_05815 [Magnetococcales bacterium]|nr:hypothetical protein [Magnetococcales bacterium]